MGVLLKPVWPAPPKREEAPKLPYAVSRRWILNLYWVIPISLALVAYDILFNDSHWRDVLPGSPSAIAWFTVFFNFPHIAASSVLLFDKEYTSVYRKHLFVGLPLVVATCLAFRYWGKSSYFSITFNVFTVYHVVGQQFGIANMFLTFQDKFWVTAWKYLGVMGAAGSVLFSVRDPKYYFGIPVILGTVACIVLTYRAKIWREFIYLWGNQALAISAFVCAVLDYKFFVLLMPRIVHDLTAYAFYVCHDRNRNQAETKNILYQALGKIGIAPVYGVVVASLLIGNSLRLIPNQPSAYWGLGLILTLIHYYTEAFTWKGRALHRSFIRVE